MSASASQLNYIYKIIYLSPVPTALHCPFLCRRAYLQNTFLELGNGQKYLSRGYVPDVPIVTAGLTLKVGLTVTNLFHKVDLVLGMNWLQLVNPVVD